MNYNITQINNGPAAAVQPQLSQQYPLVQYQSQPKVANVALSDTLQIKMVNKPGELKPIRKPPQPTTMKQMHSDRLGRKVVPEK